ncbi:MAG: HAMP domain-containing histidine kinase [Ruminococcus sp.]|nr:HAMP domain-containing histidine kinase [Ruminococcus sp.]
MKKGSLNKFGFALMRFFSFFGSMAFVITCSFLLFLRSMNLEPEILKTNAKLTFLNVLILTFLFCSIDAIRRKITVERPVKNIIRGLNEITKGDFTVRISDVKGIADENGFNVIANQVNKMTAELGSLETLRTDFIANVSHELKTPLAAINNYGTLLQSSDLPESERIEYAKAVTENSRRLANLITNILKLNKLENQQIYPQTESYNLSEQLCECLLGFETIWEQKNLELDADIDEDIIINADDELLSLVWNNLFSNAIKFTDNSGRIFVGLKKENDYAIVTVSDTGCGMSAETGKHIFEKFYQGDTSHAFKGNGLGLALVKKVVDITDGEISVQSELGKGSTFTVKLRCNADEKV